MLKLSLKYQSLCLLQVYAPNAVSENKTFVDNVMQMMVSKSKANKAGNSYEKFSVHVKTDK